MKTTLGAMVAALAALSWGGEDVEAGQKAFRRCAACHVRPDASLLPDQVWICLIAKTACVGSPAERKLDAQRRSLTAFLTSSAPHEIQRVTATTPAAPGSGTLRSNLEDGYVVLVPVDPTGGPGVRLVWTKEDAQRSRSVKAGVYQVRGYGLCRQDPQGVRWTVHASGKGQKVTVQEGKDVQLDLDQKVTLKLIQNSRPGHSILVGELLGDHGMGLSVSRGMERIAMDWKVLAGDREVSAGSCEYG